MQWEMSKLDVINNITQSSRPWAELQTFPQESAKNVAVWLWTVSLELAVSIGVLFVGICLGGLDVKV